LNLGTYARADTAIAIGHFGKRLALELVDYFSAVAAAAVFCVTLFVRGCCCCRGLVGWLERATVVGSNLELLYIDTCESASLCRFSVVESVANVVACSH